MTKNRAQVATKGRKVKRKATSSDDTHNFRRGLVIRGEAAEVEDGKMPENVTHQIVGYDAEGVPLVKRLRFTLS